MRKKVMQGSVWISVGTYAANALQTISTLILARLLIPEDFGLVALVMSVYLIIQAFTAMPMSQALIHTDKPTKEHFNTAWTLSLLRGIILTCILGLIAPLMAEAFNDDRISSLLYIIALHPLLGAIRSPTFILFQKNLRFRQSAIVNLSSAFANVVTAVSIAWIFHSYWALVCGMIMSQLIGVICSYTFSPYVPFLTLKKWRELWSFSSWLTLTQAVGALNYKSDNFLIGTLLGQSSLGLYSVGERIAKLPGTETIKPLVVTLFPAFRSTAHDLARLRRNYKTVQTIVVAVSMPISLGFALVAEPAVKLLLGEKWIGTIPVIQSVAAVYAFGTLGSLVSPLSMALGQTKYMFQREALKLAVRLPVIIVGAFSYGLIGVLVGRAIAGFVGIIIDMRFVNNMVGASIFRQIRWSIRAISASLIMTLVILVFQNYWPDSSITYEFIVEIMISTLLGGFVYIAVSTFLWLIAQRPDGPEREFLKLINELLGRLRAYFTRKHKSEVSLS